MNLDNIKKTRGNCQRLKSLKNIPPKNTYMKKPKKSKDSALLIPWESRKVQILPEKKPSLNAYLFECSTQ